MSSAFPQQGQSHNAFGAGAAAILVPERGTHIPASYVRNPHPDPDLIVKRNGVPLLGMDGEPFTISQVVPERRWAVRSDGNVMEQHVFEEAKKQTILEFFAVLRERGNPAAKYEGNLDREPIPDVAYYVSWREDPEDPTKVLEIGYDPHATDGATPKSFHDSKGDEIIASRIEVLCQAYASKQGRAQMTKAEIHEVEQHLGVSEAAGKDEIAAKLEMLTQLHHSGELSPEAFIKAVDRLTGSVGDAVEEEEEEEVESIPFEPETALCGKECRNMAGLKAHERACKKCRARRERDRIAESAIAETDGEDEG